jgi:hypothetical protein
MKIPLIAGLTQTGVIADQYGDHESIRKVEDLTPATLTFSLTNELTLRDPKTGKIVSGDQNSSQPPKRGKGTRLIDVSDIATAHHLTPYFQIGKTEHFPGSIPLGASTEVLNQLRAGQISQFDMQALPDATLNAQFQGHAQLIEVQTNWNGMFVYKCALQRVGTTDLSFPVLANGARVELPVLHAKCPQGGDDEAHFYFLDQPENALLLGSVLTAFGARTQMIKIDFPVNGGGAPNAMEQALAEKKPVEIYGIYFDFTKSSLFRGEREFDLGKPRGPLKSKDISRIVPHPTLRLDPRKQNMFKAASTAARTISPLLSMF